MQLSPEGQTPLQAGAPAVAHGTGGFLHWHGAPAAVDVHIRPGGQSPPHCGATLCAQPTTMSMQPHWLPPGIPVQT